MNPKQKRAAAVARGMSIINTAKSAGRELHAAELTELTELDAEVKAADVDLAKGDADAALFAQLTSGPVGAAGASKQFMQFKASPAAVRSALGTAEHGVKALATGADVPISFDAGIVTEGRPARTLLDVIPAVPVDGENYSYLAQTVRTNNAAPVGMGGTKPTSPMGIVKKEGKLHVIAHLSDPLDRFMLEDVSNLEQFVADELGGGVSHALIGQLLTGDGLGDNIAGLDAVSGTITQAFKSDAIRSVRAAFTTLEASGLAPAAVVMNASEWEAIETAQTTTGTYVMSPNAAPVDAAARRLYGVPVSVVPQMAAGTAWVIAEGSAEVKTDRKGIRIDFGMVGDSFAKNEVIGRGEGRFDLAVKRPAGIVKVSLSA